MMSHEAAMAHGPDDPGSNTKIEVPTVQLQAAAAWPAPMDTLYTSATATATRIV